MVIDWSTTRVHLGNSGRVRCEPSWSLSLDWSQRLTNYDLWFVWEGRGRMRTHEGAFVLRPGVALWMRPGGLYLAEQEKRHRLGVSFIHFSLMNRRGNLRNYDAPVPPLVNDVVDMVYFDGVMRRIVEMARARHPQARLIGEQLLTALLMDLDAQAAMPSKRVSMGLAHEQRRTIHQLASRIDERPNEAYSVEQMASRCGYSSDHFSRVFKKVTGENPRDYIVRARINRARILLLDTDLSIGQIADALGFQDVYFFSKQFKAKAGVPPSVYRKKGHAGRV